MGREDARQGGAMPEGPDCTSTGHSETLHVVQPVCAQWWDFSGRLQGGSAPEVAHSCHPQPTPKGQGSPQAPGVCHPALVALGNQIPHCTV